MAAVFITGGHAGLGWVTASRLASEGHVDVVLAGRDLDKVETAARLLRKKYGVKVTSLSLDLASLGSVRTAAAKVRGMIASEELEPFQALICNAGAQFRDPSRTAPTDLKKHSRSIISGTFSW